STVRVPFSTSTGLITGATVNGDTVIIEGPYLDAYINYNHLTGAEVRKISNHLTISPADWHKTSFSTRRLPSGDVVAEIAGTYKDIKVRFQIAITPDGNITTAYTADGMPDGYLRETGISFSLPESFQRLRWQREGYWDNYPADAMSGNTGDAPLYDRQAHVYGQRPPHDDWASDTRNFYYWADKGTNADRPLTMRAKSMKENIERYTLVNPSGTSLTVYAPDADVACRLDKPDGRQLTLYADNRWDYPEIAWGNYCKAASPLPFHGQITLQLKP
ncbi:MAG: beta-galactosidase, partial [Paramuribaculum sp.]|nr:beta-galactosidase [Paramuribaculum sp.]